MLNKHVIKFWILLWSKVKNTNLDSNKALRYELHTIKLGQSVLEMRFVSDNNHWNPKNRLKIRSSEGSIRKELLSRDSTFLCWYYFFQKVSQFDRIWGNLDSIRVLSKMTTCQRQISLRNEYWLLSIVLADRKLKPMSIMSDGLTKPSGFPR